MVGWSKGIAGHEGLQSATYLTRLNCRGTRRSVACGVSKTRSGPIVCNQLSYGVADV
jgi:hypothetical protein